MVVSLPMKTPTLITGQGKGKFFTASDFNEPYAI
jgi:hypothetical protein